MSSFSLNLLTLFLNLVILGCVLGVTGFPARLAAGLRRLPLHPWLAWTRWARRHRERALEAASQELARQEPVTLRVGRSLVSLVDPRNDRNLLGQVGWLRKEILRELGLLLPGVKMSDHLGLDGHEYVLYVYGVEAARGRLYADRYLACGPEDALARLGEIPTFHPLTGQPAAWVRQDQLFEAGEMGCMLMEPREVLAFHLRHAVWQQAPRFITEDFARNFLKRACELEPESSWRRTLLEPHLPRLRKALQAVLELGGDLKNPPLIVRTFEGNLRRYEEPEVVGQRIIESLRRPASQREDAALASALLYTAHWNEMLCLELFPLMDHNQLSQLTSGLLRMQHSPGPVMERLWNELGSRTEAAWGRSYQELAEQIQHVLSRGLERPQPMAGVEKLAVLILSLPRQQGPELAEAILRQLPRQAAGELTAALGRYAPLWSEAPFRPDGRQALEFGLRERIVGEFLDNLAVGRPEPGGPGLQLLRGQVRRLARTEPERLAVALEWFYFSPVEPISRFQALVESNPRRLIREMLAYFRNGASRAGGAERAAAVLACVPLEAARALRSRLRGRGCVVPETAPADLELVALAEFASRYGRRMGREPGVVVN